MLDTPEDCPRNQKKHSTSSIRDFCEIWYQRNPWLSCTWSQTPEQERAKSWAQCTSQSTQRTENTHHSPLFIIFESIATRLTANLLMIPPILGDQTAQHWNYKSGGDGIEGETKISEDDSNRWCLSEVYQILTALGESRLIPQWRSWEQSAKGQSLHTERQNRVILHVWNIMCHCLF